MREAIIWLSELGLSRVSIELDCKLVVDGISDSKVNHSEFANLLYVSNTFKFVLCDQ